MAKIYKLKQDTSKKLFKILKIEIIQQPFRLFHAPASHRIRKIDIPFTFVHYIKSIIIIIVQKKSYICKL